MGYVSNFFGAIVRSLRFILARLGTVILFIFTAGMALGYYIAFRGFSPIIFVVPLAAMVVMWRKLDEGVMLLIILVAIVFFFPQYFL